MVTGSDRFERSQGLSGRGSARGRRTVKGVVVMGAGFAGRGFEALLRMELAILLERERAQGVVNAIVAAACRWRGLGRLEFLVPRDRLGHCRSSYCGFASGAARSWKALPRRCSWPGSRRPGCWSGTLASASIPRR